MSAVAFDAIVLAGGGARRLGGIDKPGLVVGGRTLLGHVLDAVADADRIVVVGPERTSGRSVIWARESPSGGGPVAAVAAGCGQVTASTCVLIAADLPSIGPAVPALLALLDGHDAAVLTTSGRRNHLAAAWRTDALRAALARIDPPAGAAARQLYSDIDSVELVDPGGWGRDCDTWDDVRALRSLEEHR